MHGTLSVPAHIRFTTRNSLVTNDTEEGIDVTWAILLHPVRLKFTGELLPFLPETFSQILTILSGVLSDQEYEDEKKTIMGLLKKL